MRPTRSPRSATWFFDLTNVGRALLGAGLASSLLACGADPAATLRDSLDACDLGVDLPANIEDDQATCALRCVEPATCTELQSARDGGAEGAWIDDCLIECDLDLFSAFDTPFITFGADQGQLSTSAEELLGKPAGNPDPETLVGVFEVTGYGTEDRPEQFAVLSNDWRIRTETRQSGIAMAGECLIDVGGGVSDQQTLQVFVSSPIEVHDWGIKILETHKDEKVYTSFGFNVSCSVELGAMDMPFCTKKAGVPEGYSTCVTVRDGSLTFEKLDGTSGTQGKKISN